MVVNQSDCASSLPEDAPRDNLPEVGELKGELARHITRLYRGVPPVLIRRPRDKVLVELGGAAIVHVVRSF